MTSVHRFTLAAVICLTLANAPSVFASNDDELRAQQEKQRKIQAETDQAVNRITTMLRVMEFYHVKSPEKKIMEEMSVGLSKLSKNQMADVIRQLENTMAAKTEKQSEEAYQEAHASHVKVLDALHEMVARFNAVKNLEEAAKRFEEHAKSQLELHLRSGQVIRDLHDFTRPDLAPTRRLFLIKRMPKQGTEMAEQSRLQSNLHIDVNVVVSQVRQLAPKLNAEQQERVKAMDKLLAEYRLTEHLLLAAQKLAAKGSFVTANELQWDNANQLQEISRVLRTPGDALAVLKAARDKIADALNKQDDIKKEIKDQDDKNKEAQAKKDGEEPKDPKLVIPGTTPLPKPAQAREEALKAQQFKTIQDAVNADKNVKLAEKQAQIAFDTKDTANLVKPLAPDAAKALESADKAMKAAKENLIKNDTKKAAEPQAKATEKLNDAKAEIEKLIAAAEKAKNDPLTAVQKAIDNIDKIIQEQTKTRDETKETVGEKQNLKLPELAKTQQDLAKKTDEVKNTPLPNAEKVEKALDNAAKEMKAAVKNLDAEKSPEAVAKQDKAIENLKQARDELAAKAADIEKRQADIAKLEDAAKKLGDLAKEEKNVANQADKNANQPKADPAANKELAKEQAALTPKANDIVKEIDKAAPKAAEKVGESVKNMEAAKKELDKNEAKPAATEAKEAGKKLDEAQKALQDALADLKGKQAADEIALQKNDPAAAQKQIAEALKEAQKAVDASKEAQKAADTAKADPMKGDQPMAEAKADLAKQQADLAKQAADAKLPEAAKDAAKAAEAIKNGDIPKALENQAKALEKLQDAANKDPMAKGDPMKGEPMAKGDPMKGDPMKSDPMAKGDPMKGDQPMPGDAKPQGEAKDGEQPAQAKENMAQPGEAKGAEPMAKGDPMKGDTKAADAKQAQNPKKGDQPMAQAKGDQPKGPMGEKPMAQAKGDPMKGEPMAKGDPMAGEAKKGEAQAAQAKEGEKGDGPMAQAKGEPMGGEKGEPMAGQKGDPMAQAKGGKGQGEKGQGDPMAKGEKGQGGPPMPDKLAQQQKALMDATKALGQSQEATQAAQAALAQAQAQAPAAVQPALQQAQQQLQQAQQDLQKGQPGEAGEAQQKAADNLAQAQQALEKAMAQGQKPGDPGQQQAKGEKGEKGEKGMGEKGMGEDDMGQAKGDKKSDPMAKGDGERKATGKDLDLKASNLNDVTGDGSFMHLPPRQRELIRQAISGNLPPEYANLIQQYYINIARGRPASGSAPSAPPRP